MYALPIAGSLGVVQLITAATGVPTDSLTVFLLWWFGISVAATLAVSVVYKATRRLLPLGALMELSLVFPDEAPSRFQLALRSGTVESLEERLLLMRQAGEALSAQEAAEILLRLVAELDVHDKITSGHAERVRAYSYSIGKQLNLDADDLDRLNWAALLHDIGKLQVSTEILNKAGKPTDEEWEQLRQHPLYGETLVSSLRDWLGEWTEAVGYHHERWDGKGYPRGIPGEQIPLAGRIVAIADVYDVITSARSYKEAAGAGEAREEITRCAGTQFDPRLVRAFVNLSLGRMRLVMGPLSWLTHAPLLARLPITPSVGAAFGAVATVATVATTGVLPVSNTARAAAAPSLGSPAIAQPATARPGPRPAAKRAAPTRVSRPIVIDEPATPTATEPALPAPDPIPPALPFPPEPQPVAVPPAPEPAPPPPPPAPPAPPPAEPTPSSPTPPPAPAPAPPPPVNQAPTFTPGPNQTGLEDHGVQSVTAWATAISPGPANESSQAVTFSATADNTSLFAVQPAISANGTLTYTPAADAFGVATVTVTAHDDGGTANGGTDTSATVTFTITISPVNDMPGFNAGANQSVLEDTGAQSVNGWATALTPGPPNESSQTLSFDAVADDSSFFSVQPVVSPSGKLTYTLAPNAYGVATVRVHVHDNGGTANGGVDETPEQTFTITIGGINDAPSFIAGPDQTVVSLLGSATVPGWATNILRGPANESAQNVHFVVTNDNPGLFTNQPSVTPGGTLNYQTTALALGVANVTVRLQDNGGTANGGVDTSPIVTFTITVI